MRSPKYQELLLKLRALVGCDAALQPGFLRFRGERVEADIVSSCLVAKERLLVILGNSVVKTNGKPATKLLRNMDYLYEQGYHPVRQSRQSPAIGGVDLKSQFHTRWLSMKGVCNLHEMECRRPYVDDVTLDKTYCHWRLSYEDVKREDLREEVLKKRHT